VSINLIKYFLIKLFFQKEKVKRKQFTRPLKKRLLFQYTHRDFFIKFILMFHHNVFRCMWKHFIKSRIISSNIIFSQICLNIITNKYISIIRL